MDESERNPGVPGPGQEAALPPPPDIEIDPKTREVLDALFAVGSLQAQIAATNKKISILRELGDRANPQQFTELLAARAACQAALPEADGRYRELSKQHGIFLR